jgi:hypothetical protein
MSTPVVTGARTAADTMRDPAGADSLGAATSISAAPAYPSAVPATAPMTPVADYRPPGWPDQGPPQQLHLDVRVDDLEIADQRVRALGAVPPGERVVLEDEIYGVYADPAGHPFCLVQPETT